MRRDSRKPDSVFILIDLVARSLRPVFLLRGIPECESV